MCNFFCEGATLLCAKYILVMVSSTKALHPEATWTDVHTIYGNEKSAYIDAGQCISCRPPGWQTNRVELQFTSPDV